MSTTINAPAYYVCATDYSGPNEELRLNGGVVSITTAPLYTERELNTIWNDWHVYQHGPFSTLEEAQAELARIYGPCRQCEVVTNDPALAAVIVASYSIGEYERLTKEQTESYMQDLRAVSADMSDPALEEYADGIRDFLRSEYQEDSDYILEILEEHRDYLRTEEGWWEEDPEAL